MCVTHFKWAMIKSRFLLDFQSIAFIVWHFGFGISVFNIIFWLKQKKSSQFYEIIIIFSYQSARRWLFYFPGLSFIGSKFIIMIIICFVYYRLLGMSTVNGPISVDPKPKIPFHFINLRCSTSFIIIIIIIWCIKYQVYHHISRSIIIIHLQSSRLIWWNCVWVAFTV